MLIGIYSVDDLDKLRHLKNKKNILARFMMNGCHWCEQTQGDWNNAVSQATPTLSPDDAIAEIESSFVDHFKGAINNRAKFEINGFPSIIMIRKNSAQPHEARDTASILKILNVSKERKVKRQTRNKKNKSKRVKRLKI